MPRIHVCSASPRVSNGVLRIMIGALLLVSPSVGFAQTWPAKPIRLIVPWPPGGANDIIARALAEPLSRALGQPMIVDNRGGSNGIIGAEAVARAPADGHTIMFHSINSHVTNPLLYKKLTYDTIGDFSSITQIASIPLVVVAHPSFPARNITQLIAIAKARPGQVNYASFGQGSMSHLSGELLRTNTAIDIVHIPYKGAGPALVDTLAGHVPLYFTSIVPALPGIQAGRIHPLAVTSAERTKQLPSVPAVAETPGLKGFDATIAFALWAPAKTPSEVIEALNGATQKVIQTAQFRERLDNVGASEPVGGTPQQMSVALKTYTTNLARLVRSAGLQAQ
jgi:tripartite-type tricarboxylate transporter receptor subunit TctC